MQPLYMMWFDDNPKHTPETRIRAAIAAYARHFGHAPNVVLVSASEQAPATVEGCKVERRGHICKDNYWVGVE